MISDYPDTGYTGITPCHIDFEAFAPPDPYTNTGTAYIHLASVIVNFHRERARSYS
ncbi:hypothetical protein EMIT0P218_30032 [Pseudomonas sp. IT-P218]